jgi:hypothetical protein
MKRTRRRILTVLVAVAAMVPTFGAAPAQAFLFVGTCELRVTFSFNQPIGPATTLRSYSVSIAPLVSGVMPCQTTEDGVDVLRTTWLESTTGTSSVWSCGAVVAGGGWRQRWQTADGTFTPSLAVGFHQVYGTWGEWVVPLQGLNAVNFAGAIELTLDPLTAQQQTQQCLNGTLSQLRTVGVQVFEDPILPTP